MEAPRWRFLSRRMKVFAAANFVGLVLMSAALFYL